MTGFPRVRMRRLRQYGWSRAIAAETTLSPEHLIWPLFVSDEIASAEPISSMPGVFRYPLQQAVEEVARARDLGIPAVAVFPRIAGRLRTPGGEEAFNPNNLVCRAVRAIKSGVPDVGVICDVALDPYTDHGHDGLLIDGNIDNDATIEVLVKQALVQVEAGCDVIAPSDMMDGRIGAIRDALESNGHSGAIILSYAAKYASAFYGPFRDAVGVGKLKGDKKTYQMAPHNRREALRETLLDIEEGADMVMVKPAMPYLDVLADVSAATEIPCLAYQVSGEYAMLRLAGDAGVVDGNAIILESLIALRRAGAAAILTYFAREVAEQLRAR